MPFFSASVNESLTSSTSTVTGHIALQGSAPVVTGVAIAGRMTGHVGTLVSGIYGALKVNADGTFRIASRKIVGDQAVLPMSATTVFF